MLVNGTAAEFEADAPELRIALPEQGHAGDAVRLDISYAVVTESVGATALEDVGWLNTDGGSYVLNEPDDARSWLPCNDHPSDKASFTFTLQVAKGLTAVANGALQDHRSAADGEVWVEGEWDRAIPTAANLAVKPQP